MLLPNSAQEFLQKTPLTKLKSIYRVQPDRAIVVIRSRFSIECECGYISYPPFPSSCSKCNRSYNNELQQFHQITTELMGMIAPDSSKQEAPTGAPGVCKICGAKRFPGDRFCDKCGHLL